MRDGKFNSSLDFHNQIKKAADNEMKKSKQLKQMRSQSGMAENLSTNNSLLGRKEDVNSDDDLDLEINIEEVSHRNKIVEVMKLPPA